MSPRRREFKLYHGGARGLVPGQQLLPPSLTGAPSCADYDGEHCRFDRVYLTTDLEEATVYAALAPRGGCGDVYEVEPMDEPEPDPSCGDGTATFTTRAAIVVAVVRREVDVEEAAARMRTLLLALSTNGVLTRGDTNFGRDQGRLVIGRAGGAIQSRLASGTGHAHSLDGLGKRGSAPTNEWYLRPMKLRLSDPSLIPDLRQHFERSGFVTNRLSDHTIEAWRPDAASPEQERREIEAHLAVWRAMHAEVAAEVIG